MEQWIRDTVMGFVFLAIFLGLFAFFLGLPFPPEYDEAEGAFFSTVSWLIVDAAFAISVSSFSEGLVLKKDPKFFSRGTREQSFFLQLFLISFSVLMPAFILLWFL